MYYILKLFTIYTESDVKSRNMLTSIKSQVQYIYQRFYKIWFEIRLSCFISILRIMPCILLLQSSCLGAMESKLHPTYIYLPEHRLHVIPTG